jgi:hypothetical protein
MTIKAPTNLNDCFILFDASITIHPSVLKHGIEPTVKITMISSYLEINSPPNILTP